MDRGLINGRSCTVVLIGTNIAGRKWKNFEIIKSWDDGKGVVGIHIHGLQDRNEKVSSKGKNPSDDIGYGSSEKKLSAIVKCYDPRGVNSRQRYDWIKSYLSSAVEEALAIRKRNQSRTNKG